MFFLFNTCGVLCIHIIKRNLTYLIFQIHTYSQITQVSGKIVNGKSEMVLSSILFFSKLNLSYFHVTTLIILLIQKYLSYIENG